MLCLTSLGNKVQFARWECLWKGILHLLWNTEQATSILLDWLYEYSRTYLHLYSVTNTWTPRSEINTCYLRLRTPYRRWRYYVCGLWEYLNFGCTSLSGWPRQVKIQVVTRQQYRDAPRIRMYKIKGYLHISTKPANGNTCYNLPAAHLAIYHQWNTLNIGFSHYWAGVPHQAVWSRHRMERGITWHVDSYLEEECQFSHR